MRHEALTKQTKKVFIDEMERSFFCLQDFIHEGLPESCAWLGRWIAQIAFELHPNLRVDDKGMRYMPRPWPDK